MSYITLSIQPPLKILIISFFQNNTVINKFLETFHKSLNNEILIVNESKFKYIKDVIKFLRRAKSTFNYNVLIIVTHGKSSGKQTWEEVEEDNKGKREDSPFDQIVNHPFFLSKVLCNAVEDCLFVFAMCFAGNVRTVDLFTRGEAQALHMITPYSGKTLDAIIGAKAIASFFNELEKQETSEYSIDILEEAFKKINKDFPEILEFWPYGSTINY